MVLQCARILKKASHELRFVEQNIISELKYFFRRARHERISQILRGFCDVFTVITERVRKKSFVGLKKVSKDNVRYPATKLNQGTPFTGPRKKKRDRGMEVSESVGFRSLEVLELEIHFVFHTGDTARKTMGNHCWDL